MRIKPKNFYLNSVSFINKNEKDLTNFKLKKN